MDAFYAIKDKWITPAHRTESMEGQTVLLTGANTGLGLEAAKKIAALNAARLIITTRSSDKGEATRKVIQQWLRSNNHPQKTEIIPLELDMSTAEDVRAFTKRLNATTNRLDAAILNAGLAAQRHELTADGFELIVEVNAINTIFLATLLLPLLLTTAKSHTTPRLTIVSSRNATMSISQTPTSVELSPTPLRELSEPKNFPPGIVGPLIRYSQSKLLLEHAMRRLAQIPALRDDSGKPLIILNSVCPGATKSDLGRNADNWVHKLITSVVHLLVAKTTEAGARTYLTALTLDEKSMGQLWAREMIFPEWLALKTEAGVKFGDNIWSEMKELMTGWEGDVARILDVKVQ